MDTPLHTGGPQPKTVQGARAGNTVLRTMSDASYALLEPHLRAQAFEKGAVLWDAARERSHIYFPVSGLIAIVSGTEEGGGIQVGCVGRDSAAGLGHESERFTTGIVQIAGTFLSLPAGKFWSLAGEHPELQKMAACCNEWLLIQAQRNASCNAIHDAEKRLARWLLHVADRVGREITSTQEEMAQLLGLRRTTLTLIAHKLQDRGLISYKRGAVVLRDRPRLEELACECYRSQARLNLMGDRVPLQPSAKDQAPLTVNVSEPA